MLRWLIRLLLGIGFVGIATIFGPLLVAAIATLVSINTPPEPWEARSEAEKLVSIFRDEQKNVIVLASRIWPEDGAECGYEPTLLFPGGQFLESAHEARFTPYWGYYMLDNWRSDFEWEAFNARVAEEIERTTSQFELGFLRRCVTTTLVRDVCMERVETLIRSSANNVDRNLGGTESIHAGTLNDVICIYADGVAARRGLPLQSKDED